MPDHDILPALAYAVQCGHLVEHDDEGGVSYSTPDTAILAYDRTSGNRAEIDPSAKWQEEEAPIKHGIRWRNIETGKIRYDQPSAGRFAEVGGEEHTADRLNRAQVQGLGVKPGKGIATGGVESRIMMLATEGGKSLQGEGVLAEIINADKRLLKGQAVALAQRLGLPVNKNTSKTAALAHIENALRQKAGGVPKPGDSTSGTPGKQAETVLSTPAGADGARGKGLAETPDSQLSPTGDNPKTALAGEAPGPLAGNPGPASVDEPVAPGVGGDEAGRGESPGATELNPEERRPDESLKDFMKRQGENKHYKDVSAYARSMHKQAKAQVDERNAVYDRLAELITDKTGKRFSRRSPLLKDGGDHTQVPGFDEAVDTIADEFPGVFRTERGEVRGSLDTDEKTANAQKAWEIVKDGMQDYPDAREFEQKAYDEAKANNFDTGEAETESEDQYNKPEAVDLSFDFGANVEGNSDAVDEAGTGSTTEEPTETEATDNTATGAAETSPGGSGAMVRDEDAAHGVQPGATTESPGGNADTTGAMVREPGNASQTSQVDARQDQAPETPETPAGGQDAATSPRPAESGQTDFMRQEEAGPHQADDVPSYAGQSFTNDKGLTVDVRKAQDGTWSVGSQTGLTQAGVANALNKMGAQKAKGLFSDEVTAQGDNEVKIAKLKGEIEKIRDKMYQRSKNAGRGKAGAMNRDIQQWQTVLDGKRKELNELQSASKPKEQLQWKEPSKPKDDGAALPGMRDTFAPGMFGTAANQAEGEVSPTGDSKSLVDLHRRKDGMYRAHHDAIAKPVLAAIDEGGWHKPEDLYGKVKMSREEAKGAVNTVLGDMKEHLQTMWDEQGNPHYAKKGEKPGKGLLDDKAMEAKEKGMEDAKSKRARAIAELARPQVHPIVESKRYKGSDGNYHTVGGVPFGVKLDMSDSKSMGWVARHSKDGTTFGDLYPSKEAAEQEYQKRAQSTVDDFHGKLMEMDDDQLARHERTWRQIAEQNARKEGKPVPEWNDTPEQRLQHINLEREEINDKLAPTHAPYKDATDTLRKLRELPPSVERDRAIRKQEKTVKTLQETRDKHNNRLGELQKEGDEITSKLLKGNTNGDVSADTGSPRQGEREQLLQQEPGQQPDGASGESHADEGADNGRGQGEVSTKEGSGEDQAQGSQEEEPRSTSKPETQATAYGLETAHRHLADMWKESHTPEQHRANFKQFTENKEAVLKGLQGKTIKELKSDYGVWRATNKAEAVEEAYSRLQGAYNYSGVVSYNPFEEGSYAKALQEKMEKLTPEEIKAKQDERREGQAERQARLSGMVKALKDPETDEEIKMHVEQFKKGKEKEITPEIQKKYDSIKAKETLAKHAETFKQNYEQRQSVKPVEGGKAGAATFHETKHTRTGEPLYVVQLGNRVERDEYTQHNQNAKRLGGYYSSYRGNGAIPGFTFKDRGQAEKFHALLGGQEVKRDEKTAEEVSQEKKDARTTALREKAGSIKAQGNEKIHYDGKENTYRRSNMAEARRAEGRKLVARAETMERIADAIEANEAPALEYIRDHSQVAALHKLLSKAKYERRNKTPEDQREKWEDFQAKDYDEEDIKHASLYDRDLAGGEAIDMREHMGNLAKQMAGVSGFKRLAERFKHGGTLIPKRDVDDVLSMAREAQKRGNRWPAEQIIDRLSDIQRLARAGITNDSTLREALRQYLPLTAKAQAADPIHKAIQAVRFKKKEGFFPTPKPLTDSMLQRADIKPGMKVLEPSAGIGSIMDHLHEEYGDEVESHGYEVDNELADITRMKGHDVETGNFMDVEPKEEYDRVLMNPPFEKGQDIEHVQRAFEHLKPGGKLVAIMSEGPFFRQDKKAQAFREWLESNQGESEKMEPKSFKGAEALRETGTNTRMVTITKR